MIVLMFVACAATTPARPVAIDCSRGSAPAPTDGLVVVTWKKPLPGFELAVEPAKLRSVCWLPLTSERPVGWFAMPAGSTSLSYYVRERRRPWRYQQFKDSRTCEAGGALKVLVDSQFDAHGRLVFQALALGDRCLPVRTTLRSEPVSLKTPIWPPRDMPCCSSAPKGDGEE
jgi:hypothetical protein